MRRRIAPAGIAEILFFCEIFQLRNGLGEQGIGFLAGPEAERSQGGDSHRSELQEVPPGKVIVLSCESFYFVHENMPDYGFLCVCCQAFFGTRILRVDNFVLWFYIRCGMNKVLIIIGEATETVDTLYPYYRLQEDGFEPVVAGPQKRRYHTVLHEIPPDWDGQVTREFEGYTLQADIAFKDVKPEEYLGIFFSGGRAPEYIRYDEDLVRITRHFFEANKPIACVCHGVEIPAYAGCVKGRKMATVPKCKFDLEVCGGTFVNEPCVVDGNLVSGRTYHDHGCYVGVWIKMLIEARRNAKDA